MYTGISFTACVRIRLDQPGQAALGDIKGKKKKRKYKSDFRIKVASNILPYDLKTFKFEGAFGPNSL